MAYTVPLGFLVEKENSYKHVLYQRQTVDIIPNSEEPPINTANAKPSYPSKNWLSSTQLICEAGHSSLVPEHQRCVLRVLRTVAAPPCKGSINLTSFLWQRYSLNCCVQKRKDCEVYWMLGFRPLQSTLFLNQLKNMKSI